MNATTWSTNEQDIVRTLALHVRMMTLEQITRGWFQNSSAENTEAKHALDRLGHAGLVDCQNVEGPLPNPLLRPLYEWKVGNPSPRREQLTKVAGCGRKRAGAPHQMVTVYRASRRALHLFGSFAQPHLRSCEIGHDLHLAEAFLSYRTLRPRLATGWRGEATLPKLGFSIRGIKDPDAFLVDSHSRGRRVIEVVGTYEVDHLLAFHAHCAGDAAARLGRHRGLSSAFSNLYPQKGIGYELW